MNPTLVPLDGPTGTKVEDDGRNLGLHLGLGVAERLVVLIDLAAVRGLCRHIRYPSDCQEVFLKHCSFSPIFNQSQVNCLFTII